MLPAYLLRTVDRVCVRDARVAAAVARSRAVMIGVVVRVAVLARLARRDLERRRCRAARNLWRRATHEHLRHGGRRFEAGRSCGRLLLGRLCLKAECHKNAEENRKRGSELRELYDSG